ncbi:MAG: putative molybdenum carrier protein [Candidatus Aureabacteria bacterium]|nr:putative molybdenum carrier protein [Candidatus Auribacterota bacterium]
MIKKIISGGQTGVDQGALEAALKMHVERGGFCPEGRICEDGIIPVKYELTELSSSDYAERTEKNVLESDGTLILCTDFDLEGGTLLTKCLAEKHGKPVMIAKVDQCLNRKIYSWIRNNCISVLNVAGPRESKCPGIFKLTEQYVLQLLSKNPDASR